MAPMLSLLATALGLGSWIVAILMAVKMFKAQPAQIWQGILTILCGLFALIYGWMKKDELGLDKLPLIYTALLAGAIVCNIAAIAMAGAGA